MVARLEIIELGEWDAFHEIVRQVNARAVLLKRETGRQVHPPLFRGLGNSEWGLETTLERSYPLELKREMKSLVQYYEIAVSCLPTIETLTERQWNKLPEEPGKLQLLLSRSLNDYGGSRFFSDHPDVYRYFVYLRHHGFPSPLLDWSASPYIAAFFAFDAMDRNAKAVAIYVMIRDIFRASDFDVPQVSMLGGYIRAHRRHVMQQSRYSLCIAWSGEHPFGKHDQAFAEESVIGAKGKLIKIVIPASQRSEALKNLDSMNVNAYSLFGSDDSLIRTIARREALLRY